MYVNIIILLLIIVDILVNAGKTIESANSTIEVVQKHEKLGINIYYESSSSWTRKYFTGQLESTVNVFGDHLNIKLFPYGTIKKSRNPHGGYNFTSELGSHEVLASKLHACAFQHLTHESNSKAVNFINCVVNYTVTRDTFTDFISPLLWCSYVKEIPCYKMWDCAISDNGDELLLRNEVLTRRKKIKAFPYIEFTKYYFPDQNLVQKYLYTATCRALNRMIKPNLKNCEHVKG